jgi:EAL domain-containing protein (putative c-di-GMP-specific phosphodiesterase class I)
VQLEMTESVAAADPRLTITVLSHLKHMGIGVILDDFGIGSSSLSGLRLGELGCEFGQGYYFSQPLEAKAALQFLRQQVAPAQARGASK